MNKLPKSKTPILCVFQVGESIERLVCRHCNGITGPQSNLIAPPGAREQAAF